MSEKDATDRTVHPTREELAAMAPAEREDAEARNASRKVRTRTFPESNYHAVFHNGRTLRFCLRDGEDITELEFPEFYDVKITNFCQGQCPYCYQSSVKVEDHYKDIVEKAEDFFGQMSFNERPCQLAVGGGNPNEHPQFCEFMAWAASRGIMPNYTTNGMGLTDEVLNATARYCGGVALSCHPHLEAHWRSAVPKLLPAKDRNPHFKLNFHVIISDRESIDYFRSIYEEYRGIIDYFVLLPLIHQGRAKDSDKQIDYPYLEEVLADLKGRFGTAPTRRVCDLTPQGLFDGLREIAGDECDIAEPALRLLLRSDVLGGADVPFDEARDIIRGALAYDAQDAGNQRQFPRGADRLLAEALSREVASGEPQLTDLAFGARFYEWLCRDEVRGLVPTSLYEPEIMSKFLDMRNMRLYGSSFEEGAGEE